MAEYAGKRGQRRQTVNSRRKSRRKQSSHCGSWRTSFTKNEINDTYIRVFRHTRVGMSRRGRTLATGQQARK